jgi:DNA-directed RNA polymerase specialized sigma24 family protein
LERFVELARAWQRLQREQTETYTPAETITLTSAGSSQRARLVSSRLSEAHIANLIDAYRAGATISELAQRFSIGTTAVKKLLRERKARRKDLPDGWDFLRG